ncbi:acyltransferase family protein, partial [Pseudarthrobacter sp. MDT1-22]
PGQLQIAYPLEKCSPDGSMSNHLSRPFPGNLEEPLKAFYIRRSLRIWPAFYLYLLAIAALALLSTPVAVNSWQWIASALFVWNYAPDGGNWWVGHSWTLAVEEQFYLLWPIVLILLRPKRAGWAAVAVIALLPLVRVAQYFLLPETRETISVTFHTRADSLLIGCLLALVTSDSRWLKVLPRVRRLWPVFVGYLVLVAPY